MNRLILILLLSNIIHHNLGAQQTVWPGDANNNGIVNHVDLLQIGLAYNFFGPVRNTVNTDWVAQAAPNWNQNFANGLNLAHADCNGDGIISYVYDAFPIYVHYGKTHGTLVPDVFPQGIPGLDVPVTFDQSAIGNNYQPGNALSIPIVIGSDSMPVEDFYGIAFSIFVDSNAIDIDQLKVDFTPISWANPDFDRIYSTYRAASNRLDVAWVRTDRNNQNGHGAIGTLDFVIIDNVVTFQEPQFSMRIDSIRMIDRFGNTMAASGDSVIVPLDPSVLSGNEHPDPGTLRITPVPASNYLRFAAEETIHNIEIYDVAGRKLASVAPESSSFQWNIPNLMNGVYLCRIALERGVITQLIPIQH